MGKIIKIIIKTFFVLIVVVLNVLVWGRIFVSCDAPITKKIILDQQTLEDFKKNPASYSVKEYFPPITMDELGKVQLRYVTHIQQTDDLQFTLKYNIDYFEGKTPLKYVVRCVSDENENIFENPEYSVQDRYIFRYQRFSCRNINFGKDDIVYLDVYTSDGKLFTTLTLISPDISSMELKTVSLKTMLKNSN